MTENSFQLESMETETDSEIDSEIEMEYGSDGCDNSDLELNELEADEESEVDDGDAKNGANHNNTRSETLRSKLRKWAVKNNISLIAVTQLLIILKFAGHGSLPKDARTLLKTPKFVEVCSLGSGQYWYGGLKEKLSQICQRQQCPNLLELEIHIDGTPLFKSSKHELWPIQCSIKGVKIKSFFVGLYAGTSKPDSVERFIRPLIDELTQLLKEGLIVNINGWAQSFKIKIDKWILDAPARAFLKCIIGHSGYYSCERCNEEGIYITKSGEKIVRKCKRSTDKCPKKKNTNANRGHVCLVGTNAQLRTNASFRAQLHEDHHKGKSPLEELPIDMVLDFPLEYLHLLLLGVMKKLLIHWVDGTTNFKTKFSFKDIMEISKKLIKAGLNNPSEISRPSRSLNVLSFWKGKEFRTFILKTGPAVLREHLPEEAYNHFLALHCASTICSSESLVQYRDVANYLFREFVEKFGEIYGDENFTYNVHSLIHATDDVKRFGVFDNYSAFKGESNLGCLKSLIRGGYKPLQQVVKRIKERELCELEEPEDKPVEESKLAKNILRLEGLRLDSSEKNGWILTKNKEIVKIERFTEIRNHIQIHGHALHEKNKSNLYDVPIQSSKLNIFKSRIDLRQKVAINLEDMYCKLYRIQITEKESAFFPLFHFTQ